MLRGALTPDHGALTMEIQYKKDDDDETGFVMVERVSDSLRVLEFAEDDWLDAQLGDEPAVSAATTGTGKKDAEMPILMAKPVMTICLRYQYQSSCRRPKTSPLCTPFSRANVYVLMSPDAAQGTIKSVILKGSSAEIPFELEVPNRGPSRTYENNPSNCRQGSNYQVRRRAWLARACRG